MGGGPVLADGVAAVQIIRGFEMILEACGITPKGQMAIPWRLSSYSLKSYRSLARPPGVNLAVLSCRPELRSRHGDGLEMQPN